MRYGINVKYNLDQKELVDFVKSSPQLSHITEDMIDELKLYCGMEDYDRSVCPPIVKDFYNAKMFSLYVYENIGISCRLCGEMQGPNKYKKQLYRFPEVIASIGLMYPEMFTSDGNIYYGHCGIPPFCVGCLIQYRKFRQKKKYREFDYKKMETVPVEFLASVLNRRNPLRANQLSDKG